MTTAASRRLDGRSQVTPLAAHIRPLRLPEHTLLTPTAHKLNRRPSKRNHSFEIGCWVNVSPSLENMIGFLHNTMSSYLDEKSSQL